MHVQELDPAAAGLVRAFAAAQAAAGAGPITLIDGLAVHRQYLQPLLPHPEVPLTSWVAKVHAVCWVTSFQQVRSECAIRHVYVSFIAALAAAWAFTNTSSSAQGSLSMVQDLVLSSVHASTLSKRGNPRQCRYGMSMLMTRPMALMIEHRVHCS